MAIVVGAGFCAALTERGGLWMFGWNSMGQLGIGAEFIDQVAPFPPTLLGGVGYVGGDDIEALVGGVEALALVGGVEALALVGGVEALALVGGAGAPALVGGAGAPALVGGAGAPALVGGAGHGGGAQPVAGHPFAHEAVVMVSAGRSHTACLTDSGAVWVWGVNIAGDLGLGDDRDRVAPVRWGAGTCAGVPVAMVACGNRTTLVLTRDGAVWQCGQMYFTNDGTLVPALVAGLPRVCMVSAGQFHHMALDVDGCVWTWGGSLMGALGTLQGAPGDLRVDFTPGRIAPEAFGGSAVVFVDAGDERSAAVTEEGVLWVWGTQRNNHHNEPDGANVIFALPTVMQGGARAPWDGSRVLMVSYGATYALVLTEDGAVWSWGRGRQGKLGHNDLLDRWTPTRIPQAAFGGAVMVLVAAGNSGSLIGDVSMAVSEEGILYTWGQGALGHRGAAPGPCLAPFPVAATLPAGSRVGRGCRLPRLSALAFGMGTSTRLARTAGGQRGVYEGAPRDVLRAIVEAAGSEGAGPYAHMREGQLRLLGVRARVT